MDIWGDVVKVTKGDTKRIAKTIVKLVSLHDKLFVLNSKQQGQRNNQILLTLTDETSLGHLLLHVIYRLVFLVFKLS